MTKQMLPSAFVSAAVIAAFLGIGVYADVPSTSSSGTLVTTLPATPLWQSQAAQAGGPKATPPSATVETDKFDYQPGETAQITGTGFLPGEVVTLQVVHANGDDDGAGHAPFFTVAFNDGSIADQWFVNPDDSLNSIFFLSAVGATSGVKAKTIFTDALVTIVDDKGPDDYPGQKDLSFLATDYAAISGGVQILWGWDDNDWSGNNTGDACTLIDTNANGFANYSFCVTVGGSPATQLTVGGQRLYSCGDTRADRCDQPNAQLTISSSTSSTAIPANSDPFRNVAAHTTGNTCSNKPDCYTKDVVATVNLALSDVGGASVAKLINVCSYPSQIPNSAPSECVITPNSGFLTITKVASPTTGGSFTFNLGSGQTTQNGTSSFGPVANGNAVTTISIAPGTSYDLTETAPSGWTLNSIACALQTAVPTATGTANIGTKTINDFTIQSGLETICTFTNTQQTTLIVKKLVINDNGGSAVATQFAFKVNGGASTSFLQDDTTSDTLKGKNTLHPPTGSISVTEDAVSGYTTTYSTDCTIANLANGDTKTCTITNDDQAATLTIRKVVVNDNGGTKHATNFKFKVNGGTATTFTQSSDQDHGENIVSVNAGSYGVVEDGTPIDGYTTTLSAGCSGTLANGGSAICTITNDDQSAQPTAVTRQKAVLHDRVFVSGILAGGTPTFTVDFALYDTQEHCTAGGATGRLAAVENRTPDGTGEAATQTGVTVEQPANNGVADTKTYWWRVSSAGNSFNSGFVSCTESTLVTFTGK